VARGTKIGYRVVLQHCDVGSDGIIHPGVCIGQVQFQISHSMCINTSFDQDGFGFLVDEQGAVVKKPQELRVRIVCVALHVTLKPAQIECRFG
jgi:UDP-3-O-[3-hydroxymyristoyl] glucosamine N-acyltransferase